MSYKVLSDVKLGRINDLTFCEFDDRTVYPEYEPFNTPEVKSTPSEQQTPTAKPTPEIPPPKAADQVNVPAGRTSAVGGEMEIDVELLGQIMADDFHKTLAGKASTAQPSTSAQMPTVTRTVTMAEWYRHAS